MKNRIPSYPGRIELSLVSGTLNDLTSGRPVTFDMVLADVPQEEGTPLVKETLLQDTTANLVGLGQDATLNDALVAIITRLTNVTGATTGTIPISRGGTGQTSAGKGLYALANGSNALTNSTISLDDYIVLVDSSASTGARIKLSDFLAFIIKSGTSALTSGSSNLDSGTLYVQYK